MRNISMRNFILSMFAFISMMVLPASIGASDLSSKISMSDGLGGISQFSYSYDKENDVTNVYTKINIDDTVNAKILAQKPGVGSILSSFYFTLNPGITDFDGPYYKTNYYYTKNTDKSISTIRQELLDRLTEDDVTTYSTVWPLGINVFYKNASGQWAQSRTPGDGTTSIGQDLVNQMGLSSIDELVYGENYMFNVWEGYQWYYLWANEDKSKTELINAHYDIDFNISSNNNIIAMYHSNLDDAIKDGFNNISTNVDVTLNNEDELVIGKDKTITMKEGTSITVTGNVVNNGTIKDSNGKTYHIVNINEVANGKISIGSTNKLIMVGSKVYLTSTDITDGYMLKSIKVTDILGNEITVNDNSFDMPDVDVIVDAEFCKEIKIEANKETDSDEDGVAEESIINNQSVANELSNAILDIANTEKDENGNINTTVDGLKVSIDKALLDAAIANGDEITTSVDTEAIDEADIDEDIKDTIEEKASDLGYEISNYFDISININTVGGSIGRITELKNTLTFTMEVPSDIEAVADGYERTYKVLRFHDGQVDTLYVTVNDDGTISFESDKFSTYALVYKDTKKASTTSSATNNSKKATSNPNTFDNIYLYVGLGLLSIIGLLVNSIYTRREEM